MLVNPRDSIASAQRSIVLLLVAISLPLLPRCPFTTTRAIQSAIHSSTPSKSSRNILHIIIVVVVVIIIVVTRHIIAEQSLGIIIVILTNGSGGSLRCPESAGTKVTVSC